MGAFEKSEFIAGRIFAMAGAGVWHNIISSNLAAEIGNQMKNRPCLVLAGAMKVRVDAADAYFYPDLSGRCGEIEFHNGRDDIYKNPQFVIEILSESTESYDRGRKFHRYQTVRSLRVYVLVWQTEAVVEVYRKDGDRWIYQLHTGDGAALKLESVDCEVPLSEIYRNVIFPAEVAAPPAR